MHDPPGTSPQQPATVYLVGAGPGDPNLITLRGVQCLRQADVILYDYLANAQILRHANPRAQVQCLGKHGGERLWTQPEINARLIALARTGQTVVRLKGGDPAIFARHADECDALDAAAIPYEIVPGITAALAAGSCAGIPLTHRDVSSAVALITGQQQHNGPPDAQLDYAALAAFPGTLVVYMGVSTVRHWTMQLLLHGKPGETPVAIVRRCSFPDQSKSTCRLDELAEYVESRRMRPPAIMIVGQVAEFGRAASWFERRPLFGATVLVTRPESQADDLANRLEAHGAEVLHQPAIRLGPPLSWERVDVAQQHLDRWDWIVFSSAHGVDFFLRRLLQQGRDLRSLGRLRLAVIGPGTAAALQRYHLTADVVPQNSFRAEGLAEALASAAQLGERFLLVRASRGRETLAQQLQEYGGRVDQVVAYHSADVPAAEPDVRRRLAEGEIDWITVTSSAIANSLNRLFGETLRRARLVSISPLTSQTLRALGLEPAVEARQYTMEGIEHALLDHVQQ